MLLWVMAFNGLLPLVSDCYTVMIKGAVDFFAVDCSCQVLGLLNGLPNSQCTYAAMIWLAHLGNNSLAPIRNIGNLSTAQVSQSIKSYKLVFNEVMWLSISLQRTKKVCQNTEFIFLLCMFKGMQIQSTTCVKEWMTRQMSIHLEWFFLSWLLVITK